MQINAVTKKAYEGNNQDQLEGMFLQNEFGSTEWLTFIQAQSIGRKVKAGAKGTKLVRMILIEKKTKMGLKREFYPKTFTVFNIDQTEVVK